MTRTAWFSLDGTWEFEVDDLGVGVTQGWPASPAFSRSITVPFPPESAASGIADPAYHPTVWYRREVTRADLVAAGWMTQGDRMLLHFGAVDYVADVWLAGQYLGRHEGGSTPFTFDVTSILAQAAPTTTTTTPTPDDDAWALVVRAHDDPHDVAQPRGKQDWKSEPHAIWYERTTGIWQSVWLEAVPPVSIRQVAWSADLTRATVELVLELDARPRDAVTVSVDIEYEGSQLAHVQFAQSEPRSSTVISLPLQTNGQAYHTLLWTPEKPRLLDATVHVTSAAGDTDTVGTYVGLRSVGWAGGHFLLNDRPTYLRAVLAQGYWPASHLAAPSEQALRQEVQLIKDMGFNCVRIHQKIEDPRFLYWCDRLGLMVWEEGASAYEFSVTAVERMTREWLDVIRRDVSHPCIVAWVPLNESWGVQHIAHDPRQLDYAQMLYHLTRSLDPSRPVISNDGWEHADSDIWTIHDYGVTGPEVAANYVDKATVQDLLSGVGPLGRRMRLLDVPDRGQPIMVSEFGGISYAPTHTGPAWGYVTASAAAGYQALLTELFAAIQGSPVLAGFCYTQLTDTHQEANGLTSPQREPKLPLEVLRSIVLGETVDTRSHRRPRKAVQQVSSPLAD